MLFSEVWHTWHSECVEIVGPICLELLNNVNPEALQYWLHKVHEWKNRRSTGPRLVYRDAAHALNDLCADKYKRSRAEMKQNGSDDAKSSKPKKKKVANEATAPVPSTSAPAPVMIQPNTAPALAPAPVHRYDPAPILAPTTWSAARAPNSRSNDAVSHPVSAGKTSHDDHTKKSVHTTATSAIFASTDPASASVSAVATVQDPAPATEPQDCDIDIDDAPECLAPADRH